MCQSKTSFRYAYITCYKNECYSLLFSQSITNLALSHCNYAIAFIIKVESLNILDELKERLKRLAVCGIKSMADQFMANLDVEILFGKVTLF